MEKRYSARDLAKIGTHTCAGCHSCCTGMGDTVLLTPFDVYELEKNLGVGFEALLAGPLELTTQDGVILPHLKMTGEKERCYYLNEENRCSIHPFRPGLCRLFPLGREYVYEEGKELPTGFQYFVLEKACPKADTKVKIEKWLQYPGLSKVEEAQLSWHRFLLAFKQKIHPLLTDEEQFAYVKQLDLFVLQTFYGKDYDRDASFYPQFEERLLACKSALNLAI